MDRARRRRRGEVCDLRVDLVDLVYLVELRALRVLVLGSDLAGLVGAQLLVPELASLRALDR